MAVSTFFKKAINSPLYQAFNPENLAEGVKKTAKGIVGGLQSMGQSSLRGTAALGGAISGKTLTPSTYFQKELYGTDKPITLRSFGEEIPGLKDKKVAPFVGFALGAADLIPGGKQTKTAVVATLKNINKVDDAAKALSSMLGMSSKVASKYATEASKLTDTKSLTTLVDKALKESQDIVEIGKRLTKTKDIIKVDPLSSQAKTMSKEEFWDWFVFKKKDPVVNGKSVGKDFMELNPLVSYRKTSDFLGFGEYKFNEGVLKGKIGAGEKLTDGKVNHWKERISKGERPIVIIEDKPYVSKITDHLQGGREYDATLEARVRQGHSRLEAYKQLGIKEVPVVYKSQLEAIWEGANKVEQVKKTRGFIASAKEVIPEADKIAGQYIPRSTDALAIKAKNLIRDDFAAAERMALAGSDDNAVAVASELLKKYADDAAKATDPAQASALYDKAADIANTLAPKLTEQGRAIQAASILGRLTPEGQVRFAAREIQRFNDTMPIHKRIPELAGDQAKFIVDKMKAINGMEEGIEKAMEFQKIQNYIQDLVPTPLIKKLTTVWKAGLLTGIKTQGLNIFSNLFHSATEATKQVPAAIVDSAASLFTGKRTTTATLRGTSEGVKEGFEKGVRYFKTGFDERNIGAKLDYHRVNFGKGAVAKAFQVYTQTVFRTLGASDQPFYYGALSRSLMDQALAQGKNAGLKGKKLVEFAENLVQSPTEEMIRYGTLDATTSVFQNKTKLGEAARTIQKIPAIGEFLLPFGRTPSAVAMQIVNYSPVGAVKTIIQNIGKGKFDQRLFSQGIGRSLTGTAVAYIGVEMAKKGLIALEYPFGDKREQNLQKAEGVKNNAILINGKWRSPIILGPAGNLILMGGHIQRALEDSGSASEAFSKAAFGTFDSFLEQTFVTGLRSALNAITDPETYAKSYLPNLVASFVPTIVSDVARSTDPKERRPETTVERIQARVPGARRGLEPQVDILGRERERIGNPLEVLIDPSRPSPQTETPVTEELRRLTDLDFKVSPTMLGDRKGFKGLSQEENTRLWKYAGDIVNDKLNALFSDEKYKSLPDDEKAKTVEKFIDQAKINARVGVILSLTQGLSGEELDKKLSELKAGGLMTREVFNKYIELR